MANKVIADCRPGDQLAVFSFDAQTHPLLSFHESATLDPARRDAVAKAMLGQLAPSWGGTNLGQALIDAVSAIEDVADTSEKSGRMPRRVVLISDLPQGSRLEALGDFEWPSDVELELKTVHRCRLECGPADACRIRRSGSCRRRATSGGSGCSMTQSSRREKFELIWVDENGKETADPPGRGLRSARREPRGARAPAQGFGVVSFPPAARRRATDSTTRSISRMSDARRRPSSTLAPIGPTIRPAFSITSSEFSSTLRGARSSIVASASEQGRPARTALFRAARDRDSGDGRRRTPACSKQYVRGGGTVLYVVTAPGRAETLADDCGCRRLGTLRNRTSTRRDAGRNQVRPPALCAAGRRPVQRLHQDPFLEASADQTGIAGRLATVLARFEAGDAAVVEKAEGKGRLVVFASGWQPADSQLARSSKFVPLMTGTAGRANAPLPWAERLHLVFDRVPMPPIEAGRARTWRCTNRTGRSRRCAAERCILLGYRPTRRLHGRYARRLAVVCGQPRPAGKQDGRARRLETLEQAGLPPGEPFSETLRSCRAPADV